MRPAHDPSESNGTPDRSTSDRPPKAVADELLVHAMLRSRFEDTPAAMQSRLERACEALDPASRRVKRPWRIGISTAAAAVIVLGVILMFSTPRDVQADFGQVLKAFDTGDKTYNIEVGDQLQLVRRPFRQGRRGGWGRAVRLPERGAASRRLDGAVLYTRGRQYVLECRMPSGRKIARGFDGQQHWLAHPWREPRVNYDPNRLPADISEDIMALLSLDLRDILHQVRAHYNVHELADAEAPNGRLPARRFVARRRGRHATLPQRIELWFDPETSQLEQILCVEAGLHGRRRQQRQTVRISLASADPLPADWFTAEAHVAQTPTP